MTDPSRAHLPRVFVTRTLPGTEPLVRLRTSAHVDIWDHEQPPTTEEMMQRSVDCDGLLTMLTERVDETLLDLCSTVRVVANMAVGYDNIDLAAATKRGVLITNTPGVLTETTADMAFALLLASARRLNDGEQAVRDGSWGPWHPTWLLGQQVHGTTIGIVGPGRIGRAMALRASGFGMHVLYYGQRSQPDFPGKQCSFDDLLAQSDFVSVHVPLTSETEEMFGIREFSLMQSHAVFINTSRGGVVNQDSLRKALLTEQIASAALDVTTPEPLPPNHPLLEAPNLLVTPHIASATERTREQMALVAVDGLLTGLNGERPDHLVNADVWDLVP